VERQVEEVLYDKAGGVLELSDCCGKRHVFRYDLIGNRMDYDFYDEEGPTGPSEPKWTVDYQVDELNRPVEITRTEMDAGMPVTQTIRNHYDRAGNLKRVDYPNGCYASLEYDPLDRLILLENRNAGGGLLSSFSYTYDDASRRERITRHDGQYTTFGYNNVGWLKRESRCHDSGTPDQEEDDILLWQDQFEYDLVGNRVMKTHTDGQGQVTITHYEHNAGHQLVRQWTEGTSVPTSLWTNVVGEASDAKSGLKSVSIVNGTTEMISSTRFLDRTRPGQISLVAEDHIGNVTYKSFYVSFDMEADVRYGYDANSNLISRSENGETTGFQWDHENRLTKIIHSDGLETSYEYCKGCSLGRLAKMTRKDASTVEWTWDGPTMIEETGTPEGDTATFGGLTVKRAHLRTVSG